MDLASHLTIKKSAIALAILACTLVAFVAFAPRASAYPGYPGACDTCHTGGGNAPGVSLVSSDGTIATYTIAANGVEWALFNGATRDMASVSGSTFTVPVNETRVIYDVLGDPGTASSGKTTVVGGKATYLIAPSPAGANGTISPANKVGVLAGADATFTVAASAGYRVDTVTADGTPVMLTAGTYTFTNVTANHTFAATFAANPVTNFTITAVAGLGGTISPAGAQTVASGAGATFTVTASTGYQVDALTVDGAAAVLTAGQYTFSNVTANHTIAVTFKAAAPTKCKATIALTGLKSGVLKLRKTVTIKGSVKPAHSGKATVTIQRRVGHKWVAAKKIARAMNATSGAYSYGYKPTKTGTYRVKTSVAKTAAYSAATTAYKTFKVK